MIRDENAAFHSIPRFSASALHRLESCSASHARSVEMFEFCTEHGISGPKAGVAADQGTKLHALLQLIPYRNAALGVDSGGDAQSAREKLPQTLRRLAPRVGIFNLSPADLWFCHDAIVMRDRYIGHVLERSPDIVRPIQDIAFNFDHRRMFTQYEVSHPELGEGAVEFSALPDVLVHVVDALGSHHGILFDYKTGYAEHTESESNRQLTAQVAVLEAEARAKGSTYASVHVKTLTRIDIRPPADDPRPRAAMTLPRYGPPEIARAMELTEQFVSEAAVVAGAIELHFEDGGTGKLPEEIEQSLHERAQVGGHCLYCPGKTCCSKLRLSITEYQQQQLNPTALHDAEQTLERIKDNPMELADVTSFYAKTSQTLADGKIIKQAHDETAEIMRQLMTPREDGQPRPLPGAYLRDGARKLVLRERAKLPGDDAVLDEQVEAEVRPPDQVFQDLLPLLGGLGDTEFFKRCCKVEPNQVRALLASLYEMPESKVFTELLAKLPNNPLDMKANRPTVVLGVPKEKSEQTRRPRTQQTAPPLAPAAPPEPVADLSIPLPPYLQADEVGEDHPMHAAGLGV